MRDRYDAIIIGSGMGGLTRGAWLAHKGMRVLVVEQNVQVGGLCSSYQRNGFLFTPAASIITGTTKKDGVFQRLVKALGNAKDIEFIPLEQGYHVHLPDFNYFLFSGGEHARERLIDQLIKLFPHEKKGINEFFATLVKIYQQMDYATFLGTSPRDVARILFKCPTLVRTMGKGILPFVDDYVKDPKLKCVLSINSTCCNLPPSRMSLLGIAGLLIEGGLSNPHVKGGSQAVSEAFAKCVRDKGGDVLLGCLADKILIENNTACGIRITGSPLAKKEKSETLTRNEFRAEYIISNAAARQTFQKLVGEDRLGRKFLNTLSRQEPTPPFCALFLGLDMDLKKIGIVPALHIHSSSYDTDEHFRDVAAKMMDEKGPAPFFRFQLAPLSDSASAPEGKSALVIHGIPAPTTVFDNPEWQQRAIDLMIKRAEKVIPGLSQSITYQEFWSPKTLNSYTLCGEDASMGWALSPRQVGPKRLSRETPVKNLYLSGHWTAPAVGVMSTVISGLQTASIILKKEGIREPLDEIGVKGGVMAE